ncbi:MAG: hypothetical protein ABEJ06_02235 [Haloarculaceae archaeon]
MQRRVAAIYLVFFVVMGASAYSVIAVAQQPTIDLQGQTLAQGDTITVNGEEYTVTKLGEQGGGGGGHGGGGDATLVGTLSRTNESARFTAELQNGSVLSPLNSSWPGKAAEFTATIEDGDTLTYNGTEVTANVSSGNLTLVNDAGNTTASFGVGDSFRYQGNTTTITEVTDSAATLVWGENYRVVIPNASDPKAFTVVQEFNVTRRLRQDPEVENQPYQGADGPFVRYRNGTTQPLDEYLPEQSQARFLEGDTLTFRVGSGFSAVANETTVAKVTDERVVLEWTGSRTTTTELTEGAVITLQGEEYVVHFTNPSTVVLSSNVDQYQQEVARIDQYHERMSGLWGVSVLSGLSAVLLVSIAYLPTRG